MVWVSASYCILRHVKWGNTEICDKNCGGFFGTGTNRHWVL